MNMYSKNIPQKLRAGDDVTLTISLDNYNSTDYTLTLKLINSTTGISFSSTANSDGSFKVEINSSDTTNLSKGFYKFVGQVTKISDSKKSVVIEQSVEVLPNLMSAASADIRTTAQQLLEILDAALLAHGKQAYTQTYNFANRAMSFTSHDEFMNFRDRIKAEAKADTAAQRGNKRKNRILAVI